MQTFDDDVTEGTINASQKLVLEELKMILATLHSINASLLASIAMLSGSEELTQNSLNPNASEMTSNHKELIIKSIHTLKLIIGSISNP